MENLAKLAPDPELAQLFFQAILATAGSACTCQTCEIMRKVSKKLAGGFGDGDKQNP